MRKSSANKAWQTIRQNDAINKHFGLKKGTITKKKIEAYLEKYPQTSEFVVTLLQNCGHSISFLMKKTGKSRRVVVGFLLGALESVIQDTPMIGKKLITPALANYSKGGTPTEEKTVTKKGGSFYKTETKEKVHNAILSLLNESGTPKSGMVATLPYHFALENKIIADKNLNGLNFQGYEGAYNVTKGRESKLTFKRQRRILFENPQLASRISIAYGNINHVLGIEKPNRYAYIFADYCGQYKSNKQTIRHIIANDVVVQNGFIWVTFSTRNGFPDAELKALVKEAGRGNYRFVPIEGEEIYHYAESGAMCTALIQRVK